MAARKHRIRRLVDAVGARGVYADNLDDVEAAIGSLGITLDPTERMSSIAGALIASLRRMAEGMWVDGERASVFVHETAPGLVIASWYPRKQDDPGWPGSIVEVSADPSFPAAAWRQGNWAMLEGWLRETRPDWFSV